MSAKQKNNASLLSESELTEDQNKAIDFAYGHNKSLLVLPVGFGKSVIGLTAAADALRDGVCTRVLVIAPLKVCRLTWAHECQKWEHLRDQRIGLALGSEAKRREAIEGNAPIVVINLENVVWLFQHYRGRFDGLIIDELTKFKAVGGVTYKAMRRVKGDFTWRVGMTATPVEEQLEDLYAELLLLDDGATFGTSRQAFLDSYFIPKGFGVHIKWVAQRGAEEVLAKAVAPMTFIVDDGSYEDNLPDLEVMHQFIPMPVTVADQYHAMAKDMILNDEVMAVNAAVLSGKLQQIANGFVYDESGEVAALCTGLDGTFKVDALRCALHGAGWLDIPVVFVYTFKEQLAQLQRVFPDVVVLDGKNDDDVIAAWNAGRVHKLAMHPKSGGHGLNLQYGGSRMVFLSPIWSADQTAQVIGRLRRRGQRSPVVEVMVFVTEGSVESAVMLARVEGKKENAAVFMRHLLQVGRG